MGEHLGLWARAGAAYTGSIVMKVQPQRQVVCVVRLKPATASISRA